MKIVVLAGGLSTERQVALTSGTGVCRALREKGHQAILVDMFLGLESYEGRLEDIFDAPDGLCPDNHVESVEPDLEAVRRSRRDQSPSMLGKDVLTVCQMADIVFLALHGSCGEDGRIQATLDLLGVPYTGSGYLGSAMAMDKAVANALFDAAGIPHTKWLSACRWEIESDLEGVCDGAIAKLGWPIFVKPANAGSSVGITKAHDRDELKQAIALALENDHKVVFEAFVDGHEVECAVIGSDPAVATRPGEILAGAEFYTYDDKYKNGVSQVVIPARLSEEKLDEVKTYAAMAYTALNCEGLARCDFFVEHGTNRVMINEINTFPGFTPINMYPKLMEHEGTPVPALIDHLIALALERTEKQHG